MDEWDQRALLATPMRARGRILGTLEITQSGRDRVFSAEEVATAEACARMTALAVDNAMLFEHQADHARRLTSLLEAGRAVTSSLDIQEVLAALVRTAAGSLGCPEALIFEYDAEADAMTMRSVLPGEPDCLSGSGQTVPARGLPVGQGSPGGRRRRRRDDFGPGAPRRRARVDGASRGEDVPHRPSAVRRQAARHAHARGDGRGAGVLGVGPGVRARVRRAGGDGHAQRPALRERQGPAPRQPQGAELGAHRQGLLHDRTHRPRRRLRRAARGRARLDSAGDPATRGGHLPARHRQDRRGRPGAAQVGDAQR